MLLMLNYKLNKVLHKFHTEIHCHNNMCSYPKLIDFVNERLNIFQVKEKLDNNLTEKAETKAKSKKIWFISFDPQDAFCCSQQEHI